MAAETVDVLAVAFVADSSLTISNEWRIVMEYIGHLIRCLIEANPGFKVRLGFVTYGTEDTFPTPILCKRFFGDVQPVTKEMKECPQSLGIGQTNSGGSYGMAALEGFVAAIELFDIMQTVSQETFPDHPNHIRRSVNHLIHLAGAAPDASTKPRWNDSPSLDSVTWEDIPNQFKKRAIQFTSINLRPNLPRFSEVHSATIAPSPSKEPWFNVRPSHNILLADFPAPVLRTSVKRPGDVQSHPDNKRARISTSSANTSPKMQTTSSPSLPSTSVHANSPRTMAQSVPASIIPSDQLAQSLANNQQYQMIMRNLAGLKEQIRSLSTSLDNARNTGNSVAADTIQVELTKKTAVFQKFQKLLSMCRSGVSVRSRPAAPTGSQAQTQNQIPDTSVASRAGPEVLLIPSETQHLGSALSPEEKGMDTSGAVSMNSTHFMTAPPGPTPTVPLTVPPTRVPVTNPAMNAVRMQKERARSMAGSVHPQGGDQPTQDGKVLQTVVWQGSLSWNGVSAGGRKEITAFVVAATSKPGNSHSETWPKVLQLVPTRDPAVPFQELQAWIQRTGPVMCTIAAQPDVADPKGNELALRMLFNLLSSRNIYAAAAWALPSGDRKNNVLFIPMQSGIAAAFFPLTGIPDTPKGAMAQGISGLFPASLTKDILARLHTAPPEQREMMLAHFKQQQLQQQHQQQQHQQALVNASNLGGQGMNNALLAMKAPHQVQQQSQGAEFAFTNVPNYGGMSMVQSAGIGLQQQQQKQVQATMMRMAPMGNISPEMMQSFMQHNTDGNLGMPGVDEAYSSIG